MGERFVDYEQNHPVSFQYVAVTTYCFDPTITKLTASSPTSYGIPPSECMIPGKTYIGKLPGHSRPAFVRKKISANPVCRRPPGASLDFSETGSSLEPRKKMGFFSSRCREDGYYVSYGPTTYQRRYICTPESDAVYSTASRASRGGVTTSTRQTCASCGRFRSAYWEDAHPLSPGRAATPSICRKCQRDKTSSDGSTSKYRRKRRHRHRHSRRCTDTTDDSYCSLKDRRSPRRYRSDSRDYARPGASSRDNVRIVIANQPGERARRSSTRTSSEEAVRVMRRTSVVEVPERVRSRSRARSSSRAHYLDDGTAQYVEKLLRPRHRSRSRSLSGVSYVEEVVPSRSRSRRRSSTGHVQFVDDFNDPVLVSKPPRRITRRRALYFDGAASFEPSGSEDRGRPRSRSPQQGSQNSKSGVETVEETVHPYHHSTEHVENTVIPHPRHRSMSATGFRNHGSRQESTSDNEEVTGFVPLHHRQSTNAGQYPAESDSDITPRPAFRSLHTEHMTEPVHEPVREPTAYKRPYSETSNLSYHQELPQFKRRRSSQYHDDYTEDDSTPVSYQYRDDYTPMSYRHVYAPSSPPPPAQVHTDYLAEMLQSSHITPPSQQSHLGPGWGPPSPPNSRSPSGAQTSSTYRPPFYRDVTSGGTEWGPAPFEPSPTEDLYGNKIEKVLYMPSGDNPNAQPYEYDWLT